MTRLFFNPLSGLFYYLQPKRRVRRKAPAGPEVEALRTRAKAELPARLQELAAAHGFTYARVCIKNNVSNWGRAPNEKMFLNDCSVCSGREYAPC